jgi:hypothetical protein
VKEGRRACESPDKWGCGRAPTGVVGESHASRVRIPGQAATQGGCFTSGQAAVAGWSRGQLCRALASGALSRVRWGVWIETALLESLDVAGRHAVTVRAEQLVLGPRWYAARRSAAVLCGLPLLGKPPTEAQLLAEQVRGVERSSSRHRQLAVLPDWQRGTVRGVQCTAVPRTAMDVARREAFRNGVVVADAVLGLGVDRASFFAVLARMERWPGVQQARRVAEFADGLSESPLESISRAAIHELDLPAPELQVEVWLGDQFIARVDKLWRAFNTVGEDDGIGKYGEDEDARRLAFKAAKAREERLEDVGLEVARWGWDEAFRPRGVLDARLLRAFERGSRQVLDSRVRFVTTTVADRLRRAA